ncbi:MAG: ImmA/IrrE family metallo-endopeptidase [Eubacterium sp.]|nr:ImmA/IrrE family metallo-endopeptidase [Eubacterium sp.]
MSESVKQKARKFCREYRVFNPSKEQIEKIIESLGFTIIEYNLIYNDPDVNTVLAELKLTEEIVRTNGFTYTSDKYRLVFINENLSDEEKQIVLLHELGHIYCGHFSHSNIIGLDVKDELEANEFAHYVMFPALYEKLIWLILSNKKKVIAAIIVIAVCCGIAVHTLKEQTYFGEYYVTESGQKYHEKECIFIKNKTNVHRLTKEGFESGDYEPCKVCLP